MEGGLLLHASWLLCFTFVWVYRRYFETVAPRDRKFEAFCASGPVLAAVRVRAGAEATVLASLRGLIPRGEVVATFGGWPWTHHALSVRAEAGTGKGGRDIVVLRIASGRVLRSREVRPPALNAVLDTLHHAVGEQMLEIWLHSGAYYDVRGQRTATRGWRMSGAAGERPRFEPWDEAPPAACAVVPSPRELRLGLGEGTNVALSDGYGST